MSRSPTTKPSRRREWEGEREKEEMPRRLWIISLEWQYSNDLRADRIHDKSRSYVNGVF